MCFVTAVNFQELINLLIIVGTTDSLQIGHTATTDNCGFLDDVVVLFSVSDGLFC